MKYLPTLLLLFALIFPSRGADEERDYGPTLPIIANAGTGPVMDVVVIDHLAYAIGRGALHVVDISTPTEPKVLGKLGGLGEVRQLVVSDGVAYIGSRHDGLFIVEVKNPGQPKLLKHYDTVEFATGMELAGDVLFAAHRNFGVELIDVSDPSNPQHLSLIRTGEAQSVVSRDGFLYVGVWASSELVVVDARNPRQPTITARCPLDGYGDGVDVEGNYVYVATGHHSRGAAHKEPGDPGFGAGHGLEVFSLDDPAQPEFVSRIKFPPLYEIGNDMWSVTVANDLAFVADTWNGIFVVDVSDPGTLQVIAHCKPPKRSIDSPRTRKSTFGNFIGGLALTQDYILMAGGFSDLHVVKAAGLAAVPTPETDKAPSIGKALPPEDYEPERWKMYRPEGQVYSVDLCSENLAAVACGSAGTHIVKLWPEIELLQVLPSKGFAMDVSVSGNRIYVAESAGGLSIWEKTGGDQYKPVGGYQVRGKPIRQVETPDSGNRIIIQVGGSQFSILDVSDPVKVKPLLTDQQRGLLYGDQMMRGLVEDRYAAIHWHVGGVYWYDLKAKPLPVSTGDNFPVRIGSKNGLIALGDKTLATVRKGYVLLDKSDRGPLDALEIYSVGIGRRNPGTPNIDSGIFYAADRSTGLVTVANISDPKNPKPIENFVTPGNPGRIAISKGCMIIADGYHGLMVEKK